MMQRLQNPFLSNMPLPFTSCEILCDTNCSTIPHTSKRNFLWGRGGPLLTTVSLPANAAGREASWGGGDGGRDNRCHHRYIPHQAGGGGWGDRRPYFLRGSRLQLQRVTDSTGTKVEWCTSAHAHVATRPWLSGTQLHIAPPPRPHPFGIFNIDFS